MTATIRRQCSARLHDGGTSVAGSFIQTLTMIDVATGWTDCHAGGVARGRPCRAAVERAQSLVFLGHWRRRGGNTLQF